MKSIWLSECDPAELRDESPHIRCRRGEPHEGHAWRGTTSQFGGAVEVTRTYWCEGIETAPESPADASTEAPGTHETREALEDAQEGSDG
jgi:hypothetical protein